MGLAAPQGNKENDMGAPPETTSFYHKNLMSRETMEKLGKNSNVAGI